MDREALRTAVGVGLITGYIISILTGQFGAGLSAAIALGLGSYFMMRGRPDISRRYKRPLIGLGIFSGLHAFLIAGLVG